MLAAARVLSRAIPRCQLRILAGAAPRPAVSCRGGGAFDGDVVGHLVAGGRRRPVARFASSTPSTDVEGDVAAMALYAGKGVGDVNVVRLAAEVVADLVAQLG